jgi:multidrug efflux pump subunit AcrA (membrane-fusion protein)
MLCGVAYGFWRMGDRAAEPESHEAATSSSASEDSVELEEEAAERLGLAVEPAREAEWSLRVAVYGRVVPNARATAEVRAAFAGILRSSTDASWPAPGQHVPSGQVLGFVDVRVGPEIRMELQNKMNAARLRRRGEEQVVQIHERTVASLKKVTDRQILSRAELDAAQVQLEESKIQLATAEAEAALWEKAIQDVERYKSDPNSIWSQPIRAPSDGDVTELAGRAGMAVEPGALILQLVDFRRPLVRLDVPAEAFATEEMPDEVILEASLARASALSGVLSRPHENYSRSTRSARLLGPAPGVDFSAQFVGYWYEVQPIKSTQDKPPVDLRPQSVWRPGLQVKASLQPAGSSSQPAVALPVNAVLFHEGRSLVYVRVGDERYERREVHLLGREGDTWIVAPRSGDLRVGVAPGEPVVHRQAQILLSKEFLKGGADLD